MPTLQEVHDLFQLPAFLQRVAGATIMKARQIKNDAQATADETRWSNKAMRHPLQMAERMRGAVAVELSSIDPTDANIITALAAALPRFADVDLPE